MQPFLAAQLDEQYVDNTIVHSATTKAQIKFCKTGAFQYTVNGQHVQFEVIHGPHGTRELQVLHGQFRQPFIDYINDSAQNLDVMSSSMQNIPKAARISFEEVHISSKLEAMQLACAEAKVRERKAKEHMAAKALPAPPGLSIPWAKSTSVKMLSPRVVVPRRAPGFLPMPQQSYSLSLPMPQRARSLSLPPSRAHSVEVAPGCPWTASPLASARATLPPPPLLTHGAQVHLPSPQLSWRLPSAPTSQQSTPRNDGRAIHSSQTTFSRPASARFEQPTSQSLSPLPRSLSLPPRWSPSIGSRVMLLPAPPQASFSLSPPPSVLVAPNAAVMNSATDPGSLTVTPTVPCTVQGVVAAGSGIAGFTTVAPCVAVGIAVGASGGTLSAMLAKRLAARMPAAPSLVSCSASRPILAATAVNSPGTVSMEAVVGNNGGGGGTQRGRSPDSRPRGLPSGPSRSINDGHDRGTLPPPPSPVLVMPRRAVSCDALGGASYKVRSPSASTLSRPVLADAAPPGRGANTNPAPMQGYPSASQPDPQWTGLSQFARGKSRQRGLQAMQKKKQAAIRRIQLARQSI